MATLASIKKQIADLEKKAEALIKAESKDAIAKVRAMIEKYQLTAADLGFMTGGAGKADKPAKAARGGKRSAGAGKKKASAASVGVPMYQDPKTGKTWTGRGKPPNWLAGVKDRSAFLIGAAAAPVAGEPKKAAAPRKATKAAKAGNKAKVAKAAAAADTAPAKAPRAARKGAKPAKPARAAGKKAAPRKKAVNGAAVPVPVDAGQPAEASAT